MTVLALLFNGCAVTIHDFPVCYPWSPAEGGGAHCNHFLTNTPEDLTQAQWQTRLASWKAQGWRPAVTASYYIGVNKAEVEKLCTIATCTAEQVAAQKKLLQALERVSPSTR